MPKTWAPNPDFVVLRRHTAGAHDDKSPAIYENRLKCHGIIKSLFFDLKPPHAKELLVWLMKNAINTAL